MAFLSVTDSCPQTMIKSVFFTCSLKQYARLDPKWGWRWGEVTERTFVHPIFLELLFPATQIGWKQHVVRLQFPP